MTWTVLQLIRNDFGNFWVCVFCNPLNWTYKRTCSILWSSSLIRRVLFNPAQTWAPYKYVQGDSLRLRVWVRTFKCANKSTYVNKKIRVSSAHVIHWERIFLINKHRNEVLYRHLVTDIKFPNQEKGEHLLWLLGQKTLQKGWKRRQNRSTQAQSDCYLLRFVQIL